MTDEEKAAAEKTRKDAEEKARADAENGEKLDKLLKGIDAVCSRLDAHEARMDSLEDLKKANEEKKDTKKDSDDEEGKPKELIADKGKKDSEDEKDKKVDEDDDKDKKADAVDMAALRRQLAELGARIPLQPSDADYARMADAQARADAVCLAFGDSASRPLQGETYDAYRVRLLTPLKKHSPAWKDVDLAAISRADAATFKIAEDAIYADAAAAARNPASAEDGALRMIKRDLPSGHRETTFYGRPSSWMSRFSGNRRCATRINPLPHQNGAV